MTVRLKLLFLIPCLTAMAQPPAEIGTGSLDMHVGHERGGSPLFSTFDGIAAVSSTATSQHFTDVDLMDYSTFAADDFTVPSGEVWTVEIIQVEGTFFNLQNPELIGPADSVNVYILPHNAANGLPDVQDVTNTALSVFYAENAAYTDAGFGDFTIDVTAFNGGAVLPAGTYWLVVQTNQERATTGQWGWTESSAQPDTGATVGNESAWMQTDNILGAACVDVWGRRVTDCNIPANPGPTPRERDLAFELDGVSAAPGLDVSFAAPLQTDEDGGMAEVTAVLAAPPVEDVSVDFHSSDPGEALLSAGRGLTVSVSLNFTPENWDQPQTVTLVGVDDFLADGDAAFQLQIDPLQSDDAGFQGLDPDDPLVVNLDNDAGGGLSCEVTRLTFAAGGDAARPAVSGDGNLIAFDSNLDFTGENPEGNREIFLYDRQAQSIRQLTVSAVGDATHAAIDVAGTRVAFASTADLTGGNPGGLSQIFFAEGDPAMITQVTASTGAATGARQPAISGDGQMVAFLSDADPLGANPDGGDEAFLFPLGPGAGLQVSDDPGDDPANQATAVSIDGDGARVAFTKGVLAQSLFLFEVGVGVSTLDGGDAASPAISSDGARIAFVSDGDPTGGNGDGNREVFLFDGTLRGAPVTQITSTTGTDASLARIGADGARLAFVSDADLTGGNGDGGAELFSHDLGLASTSQVTDEPGALLFAGLALDQNGRRFAFAHDASGVLDIYFAGVATDILADLPGWPLAIDVRDLILAVSCLD